MLGEDAIACNGSRRPPRLARLAELSFAHQAEPKDARSWRSFRVGRAAIRQRCEACTGATDISGDRRREKPSHTRSAL